MRRQQAAVQGRRRARGKQRGRGCCGRWLPTDQAAPHSFACAGVRTCHGRLHLPLRDHLRRLYPGAAGPRTTHCPCAALQPSHLPSATTQRASPPTRDALPLPPAAPPSRPVRRLAAEHDRSGAAPGAATRARAPAHTRTRPEASGTALRRAFDETRLRQDVVPALQPPPGGLPAVGRVGPAAVRGGAQVARQEDRARRCGGAAIPTPEAPGRRHPRSGAPPAAAGAGRLGMHAPAPHPSHARAQSASARWAPSCSRSASASTSPAWSAAPASRC
jgi:hypothetical protein